QAEGAVPGAGVDGDGVAAARAGHATDRGAAQAARGQGEVGAVHPGDCLREGDGVVDHPSIGRAGVSARDRLHRGSRLVDAVDLAGGEVTVAGAGAAELVAGGVGDAVVLGQVQPEGAVARAGVDRHRVTAARARHVTYR